MLLSYSLLVFALTSSVTAQWWQSLLHNTDYRLTQANRYWYRVKSVKEDGSGATFSWLLNRKYEDVIQFHPAETTSGISTVSFLELRRVVQLPNEYCLHVPPHGNPYKELLSRQSLSSIHLRLGGFWGRSTELSVTVSNFRKA